MDGIKIVIGSWGSYNECNERALGSKWLDLSEYTTWDEIADELKNEGFVLAVLNYLQQNATDVLADKINNGVQMVKDGVTLINKKTLDGFFRYATEEARKLVAKDARCACVLDRVVFGWAIHYFEEDEIEGTFYNLDGTEYKTAVKRTTTPTATTKSVITKPKKNEGQLSIFDMTLPDDEPDDTDEDVCEDTDDCEEAQIVGEPIAQQTTTHTIAHDNVQTATPTQVAIPQAVTTPEQHTQPTFQQSANTHTDDKAMFYYKYEIMQRQYPNNILLYRVGDFYEALDKGAELLARTIGLTLTGLSCGGEGRHPMCGIPYHALDVYVDKIKQHFAITIMDSDNDVRIVEKNELSVVDAVQQNAQRLAELDEDNAEDFVPVTAQQTQQKTPDDIQNVTKNAIRMQNSDTCETDSATVDMKTGEIRSASINEENCMFNVLYELFDRALTIG